MLQKSKVVSITLGCLLTLVFAAGSFSAHKVSPPENSLLPQTAMVDCSKDDEIVNAVVESIKKEFTEAELKNFKEKKTFHVQVFSKKRVVTIKGFVEDLKTYNRVVKAAKGATKCIKRLEGVEFLGPNQEFDKNKRGITFTPYAVHGCNELIEETCCGDQEICVPKGTKCPQCVINFKESN